MSDGWSVPRLAKISSTPAKRRASISASAAVSTAIRRSAGASSAIRISWLTASHARRRLQLPAIPRAELGDFGRNDGPAVRLLPVEFEILLMVVLRLVEGLRRRHLGDDRVAPDPGGRQVPDHLLGGGLLGVAVVEDRRAILRALVRTLPVERGRVVHREERVEDLPERDDLRVEGDLDRLGVPGAPRAHLTVRGIRHGAAGIAGDHAFHAL